MQPFHFNLSLTSDNNFSPILNFMKKAIIASFGVYFLITLYACNGNGNAFSQKIVGKGEMVTDKRTVGNFTKISAEFSGDVVLKQGNETAVDVVAQANIAQELETFVDNNTLHIKFKRDHWGMNFDKLTVYVVTPNIEGIYLHGSGNIKATTDIKASNIEVKLNGSGNIELKNVDCTSLASGLHGSGNINFDGGSSQSASYSITGSGDISAENLKSKSVVANSTVSGSISCNASESITAKSTGSGGISYTGHPAQTMVHSNGSGSINSH